MSHDQDGKYDIITYRCGHSLGTPEFGIKPDPSQGLEWVYELPPEKIRNHVYSQEDCFYHDSASQMSDPDIRRPLIVEGWRSYEDHFKQRLEQLHSEYVAYLARARAAGGQVDRIQPCHDILFDPAQREASAHSNLLISHNTLRAAIDIIDGPNRGEYHARDYDAAVNSTDFLKNLLTLLESQFAQVKDKVETLEREKAKQLKIQTDMKNAIASNKDFTPITATTALTTAQQSRLNRIKDFAKQAPDIPWVAPGPWGDLVYVDPNSVTEPIEGMFPVATLDQPLLPWAHDFDQDIADIDFMAGVGSRQLGECVREIEGHGGVVEDWAIRYRFKTQEALQTIRSRRIARENEHNRRVKFAGKPLPEGAKIVNYYEHFQAQKAQDHLRKLEEAREGSSKHGSSDNSSSENGSNDKTSEPGSKKSSNGSPKNGSNDNTSNPGS